MKIELLYFDGCPSWRTARARLTEALDHLGRPDQAVHLVRVASDEQAEALRFAGSPTLLVDDEDLFPHPTGRHGLACRLYATPDGLAGSPTVGELVGALSPRARPAPRATPALR